jgi:hypothetical protein
MPDPIDTAGAPSQAVASLAGAATILTVAEIRDAADRFHSLYVEAIFSAIRDGLAAGESHDAITVGLVDDAEQAGLVLGLAPDSEQLGQFTRATATIVGKILAHVSANPEGPADVGCG